jgi:hypothetical protein
MLNAERWWSRTMAQRTPAHDEKRLADRLRREAETSRPPFSATLHARISKAIQHEEPPAPLRRRTSRAMGSLPALPHSGGQAATGTRRRWWAVAAAAAVLAGALCVASWLRKPTGAGPTPPDAHVVVDQKPVRTSDAEMIAEAPTPAPDRERIAEAPAPAPDAEMIADTTGRVAEQFGMLVDSTLTTGQWAYLDHDARVAAQLLIDQLPLSLASVE